MTRLQKINISFEKTNCKSIRSNSYEYKNEKM